MFEYEISEQPAADDFDAFNEGIEPGGLRNRDEIKVLICYLLNTLERPISREHIGNIMQEQCIANYFEAMDAVSELLSNGNIKGDFVDEKEYLEITDLGRQAVNLVERDLPKTVREKAVKSALRFMTLESNERDNDVKIVSQNDGYSMSFTMKEKETVLMELHMYVPDADMAQKIKDNFIEDPAHVYSTILASLMVD